MEYLTAEFIKGMEESKEKEMLASLSQEFKTMFPRRCRILGAENLNLFLTHQQERARYYNYIYYDDLKRYALIAFYLGTYFDEDSLYPWVQRILKEEENFGVKVDLLNTEFYKMFDRVYGKDVIYFREASKKLQNVKKEHISQYKSYDNILNRLGSIYPQQMKEFGQENFKKILIALKPTLDKYKMYNPLGYSVYATLIFFMGSHVDKDPLYAWIGKCLKDENLTQTERIDFLFDKGVERIRKELIGIEKLVEKGKK